MSRDKGDMARLSNQRCTAEVDGEATNLKAVATIAATITAALLAASLAACGTHEAPMARPAPVARSAPRYTIIAVRPISFPFAGETLAPHVARDGAGGFLVSWIGIAIGCL